MGGIINRPSCDGRRPLHMTLSNIEKTIAEADLTIKAAWWTEQQNEVQDTRRLKVRMAANFQTVREAVRGKFKERLGEQEFLLQCRDGDGDLLTITDNDWGDVVACTKRKALASRTQTRSPCSHGAANANPCNDGVVIRLIVAPYHPHARRVKIPPPPCIGASDNVSIVSHNSCDDTWEHDFPAPSRRPESVASTVRPEEILGHHKSELPGDWTVGKELLGKGGYGKVYRAMISNGALMAVKKVEVKKYIRSKDLKEELKMLEREISVLKGLDSPLIVRYYGMEMEETACAYIVYILMEFVAGGSISSLLQDQGRFTEKVIQNFTRQILLGLEYLHENNIIHRDIKGGNVLVTKTGSVKISDFGASRKLQDIVDRNEENNSRPKGTVQFMAPEVCAGNGSFKGSDIWSLGCTVLEMATRSTPYPDISNDMGVLYNVGNRMVSPRIPSELSDKCRDFLRLCFHPDHGSRPSAKELLQHSWFEDVQVSWCLKAKEMDMEESLMSRGGIERGACLRSSTHDQGTSTDENGTAPVVDGCTDMSSSVYQSTSKTYSSTSCQSQGSASPGPDSTSSKSLTRVTYCSRMCEPVTPAEVTVRMGHKCASAV